MQAPPIGLDRDRRAAARDERCITELPGMLVVDFQGCDAREVASVYRSLAVRVLGYGISAVLLKSGHDAPEGHVALLDVLPLVMRHRNAPRDFALALLPQTERAKWVFQQIALRFPSSRLRVLQSDSEAQAREWMQAR